MHPQFRSWAPEQIAARHFELASAELALRARRCGVPVVSARPWSDSLDRVEAALRDT